MASRAHMDQARPGDTLRVIHDFTARSPDELNLIKNDLIELVERDDEFGDGWFLGKHLTTGDSGLFPEVYTALEPKTVQTFVTRPEPQHPRLDYSPAPMPDFNEEPHQPPYHHPVPPFNEQINDRPETPGQSQNQHNSQIDHTMPLQTGTAATSPQNSQSPAQTRSISMTFLDNKDSPVMNETLSKIDEHLANHTPRHSIHDSDRKGGDSASEYSSQIDSSIHRLSYIQGQETDEEENEGHSEQEVQSWTPLQVAEYLEDVGVERKYCNVFQDQEISGEILLGMDQAQLFIKEFELGAIGPRLRIWQKIKALQEEVHHSAGLLEQEGSRTRSTSLGTMLPRIPSVMESPGSSRTSRHRSQRNTASSGLQPPHLDRNSPMSSVAPSPGLDGSSRPSAASVRNMQHHRRHSSMEPNSGPPTPNIDTHHGHHQKQQSFDRGWLMNHEASASNPAMRPVSHGHGLSSDKGVADTGFLHGLDTVGSKYEDLDRGYFSGGEVDNRKNRNVLRKKDSPGHSRQSSYASENKRLSSVFPRHSRAASHDSARETVKQMTSAAQVYYGSSSKKGISKSATQPDFSRNFKSMVERSPTVTKLDYKKSGGIDTVTSPKHDGSSPNLSRDNSGKGNSYSSFFSRPRTGGLRAISDAITGTEKNLVTSPIDMNQSPSKDVNMQSPARTGSSTPSVTSKSIELEQSDRGKSSTSGSLRSGQQTQSSTTTTITSSGTRRKAKKKISAYTHGLEKRSPAQQMEGCDYSGWMKKKSSNLMTTWKPRLFVLRGRRLSYYYSENDTEEKGLIDISGHRVLPADNERITGLHAQLTGATTSPTVPQSATMSPTSPEIPASAGAGPHPNGASTLPSPSSPSNTMFIFKLVPPRSGLSKGVNFTKPMVHYFAVDNVAAARLWMAAMVKATIDRDSSDTPTISTYQQKTISLERARQMRQRPPALMDDDDVVHEKAGEEEAQAAEQEAREKERRASEGKGLAIKLVNEEAEDGTMAGAEEREKVDSAALVGSDMPKAA